MDEPTRLVCPECDIVYRVKRFRSGKHYACKNCGASLRSLDGTPLSEPGDGAFPSMALDDRTIPFNNASGERAAPAASNVNTQVLRELLRLTSQAGETVRETREELSGRLGELDAKLSAMIDSDSAVPEDAGRWMELEKQFAEIAERLRARLGEAPVLPPELDLDLLATKLMAGLRARASYPDEDSGTVVDALARVADELVREQSANSSKLEQLAAEIRQSVASMGRLEGWRNDLPVQVADEIGRTVEERVVAPISGALARQAPAILSELQDSKLVDIVSRSVREAQRPLLREIVTGGRGGVPAWLFASILLPLLLIVGYLFMPGDTALTDNMQAMRAVADGLSRLEQTGMPLTADLDERMQTIEDVVMDIHGQALTHAKNAAALEEEARNLRTTLAERDALIKEYSETLQNQVRRLRAYEMRLTRLGVSPETVAD